jgi:hypothetical protein
MTHPARYLPNKAQKPIRGILLNRAHPLAKGMIVAYIFNELTGNTVRNLAGDHHHGTFYGTPIWKGGTLWFSDNNYVEITTEDFDMTDKFTILTQVNNAEDHTDGAIIGCYQTTPIRGLYLRHDATDKFTYGQVTGSLKGWGTAEGSYPPYTDVSVAFRYGEPPGWIYSFIDGLYDGSTYDGGDLIQGMTEQWRIGSYNFTENEHRGPIYYFYIYNRALSAEEIAIIHREPYAMF